MFKEISFELYKNLKDDFFHQVKIMSYSDGSRGFIAFEPNDNVLDGLFLSIAKREYEEAVYEIKSAQEWIAERKEKGLGYDEEGMRKTINSYRSRKSRAKKRIVEENKKFEKELAWCIVYKKFIA